MADQSKYTHKLQGCHVLIIGGTSGVGFAVAEACIEHGAKTVIVSSSNTSNISATIKRLKTAYPEATAARTSVHGFPCDLANADNIEDNVSRLFSDCMTVLPDNAKLDHVVFTAGNTIPQTQLADTTLATIQTFAQVRFFGALLVAKHARAHISPSPKSSLTLSAGSGKPVKGWLTGHSLSAGLQGMTEALACELAPIRVNIVSMGAVATELWAKQGVTGDMLERMQEMLKNKTLTGRVGQPEDVAEAYLYSMKDVNVTGVSITTDSGSPLVSG